MRFPPARSYIRDAGSLSLYTPLVSIDQAPIVGRKLVQRPTDSVLRLELALATTASESPSSSNAARRERLDDDATAPGIMDGGYKRERMSKRQAGCDSKGQRGRAQFSRSVVVGRLP